MTNFEKEIEQLQTKEENILDEILGIKLLRGDGA